MSKREERVRGRPDIMAISSGRELRRWYWLKADLMECARQHNVKSTGGKFEILERIAHFLDTGEEPAPNPAKRAKVTSKFDWHCEVIDLDTPITDSYKNTQNVRRFFKAHAGESFKFNIEFMAWMKANIGKTLADALDEYHAMHARMADPQFQSKIEDHNQFNLYTREFLADNPNMGMDDVRKFWSLKIKLPSDDGRHKYDRSDLQLT